MELMYPKSSGLDVHKNFVVACVYVCDAHGKEQAIRKRFGTMTHELLDLVRWLKEHGITHVVMESTGVYWKPVYNLLRPCCEVWIVNAQHLAKVPGRKTDDTDAMWITKLMRYGQRNMSIVLRQLVRNFKEQALSGSAKDR